MDTGRGTVVSGVTIEPPMRGSKIALVRVIGVDPSDDSISMI